MFKKLEDRKLGTLLGKSSSEVAECGCSCVAIQAVDKDPTPENSSALVLFGVHVELNG